MREMRPAVRGCAINHRRAPAVLAAMTGALLLALGAAGTAQAGVRHDVERFRYCPYENPEVIKCLYALTTSGEFKLGNSTSPIVNPVTLQGGVLPKGVVAPATNGETLSKTPEPVPGGLTGTEIGGPNEITATAELAGTPESSATTVLPLKVKLTNATLGENCYIGSDEEPISLHLVFGEGEWTTKLKDGGSILELSGTQTDSTFAAPGANGCTAVPELGDELVDQKSGLPSPSGNNLAKMTGSIEEATPSVVEQVLPLPEFGHCVKVAGTGSFKNSACTKGLEHKLGAYEFVPGPGANPAFSGVGKTMKLQSVGGTRITCTSSSESGEYTGAKTETETITLSGCYTGSSKQPNPCQSSGASPGEIKSALLDGSIDFVAENAYPVKPVVGVDLTPASGTTLFSFECAGSEATSVGGSVIVALGGIDRMSTALKLKAKQSGGIQSVSAFEEGPSDTLTYGSGEEQAGLNGALERTNAEAEETKAIPNP
jgi:hypothetical protein